MARNIVITVDGQAGTGKSSIGHYLHHRKRGSDLWVHIDSGVICREAACEALLSVEIKDPTDDKFVLAAVEALQPNYRPKRFFDPEDLYTNGVTKVAGIIGNDDRFRFVMHKYIYRCVADHIKQRNIVITGRDAGTEVYPQADHRFFLTCGDHARVVRRQNQLNSGKKSGDDGYMLFSEVEKMLVERDKVEKDTLRVPRNAKYIDSSKLSIEEVAEQIVDKCQKYSVGEKVAGISAIACIALFIFSLGLWLG